MSTVGTLTLPRVMLTSRGSVSVGRWMRKVTRLPDGPRIFEVASEISESPTGMPSTSRITSFL